ncbi:hypothetical protein ABH924_005038 [Arthrobacter sp. GAS37]
MSAMICTVPEELFVNAIVPSDPTGVMAKFGTICPVA